MVMRELTIEEKAQRFDEALKAAVVAHKDEDKHLKATLERIFHELKESEDERIRQAIIKGLSSCGKKYWGGFEVKAAIAWLEKQGEQKQEEQPRYNIGDILCDLSCNEYDIDAQLNYEIIDIRNGMYICDNGSIPISQQNEYRLVAKKAEQKPIKVSNDEDSVSNELREASFIFAATQMVHKASPEERKLELIHTFEEGAKWQEEKDNICYEEIFEEGAKWQSAQNPTWSEEDEYMTEKLLGWLSTLINYISEDAMVSLDLRRERIQQVEQIKTWLTSLKDRHTWKPSDEQMIAMNDVITNGHLSNANERILKGLQDQLKKLK